MFNMVDRLIRVRFFRFAIKETILLVYTMAADTKLQKFEKFWTPDHEMLSKKLPTPNNPTKYVSTKNGLLSSVMRIDGCANEQMHCEHQETKKSRNTNKPKTVKECQEVDCEEPRYQKYSVCEEHFRTMSTSDSCYTIVSTKKNAGNRCGCKPKQYGLCGKHLPKEPKSKDKPKIGVYTRQIRLYPTMEQRSILKQWFGVARKVYNSTLKICQARPKLNKSLDNLRFRIEKKLYHKNYINRVPYHIKDNAISDYIKADDNARLKYRTTKKRSQMRFRSKKQSSQSIQPKNESTKPILNSNNRPRLLQLYQRYLSPIKTKEDIPDFSSCRIVMKYGREFYLSAEVKYGLPQKNQVVDLDRTVAIDPNTKNMLAFYSTSTAGVFGENINQLLDSKNSKISRLQHFESKVSNKRTKKMLRRKIIRQFNKREGIRDEIHWKLANALLKNYDTVIIPEFQEQKKCKTLRKSTNRQMFGISHSLFRDRLTHKADIQGKRVIIMTEEYTSKTCSQCGHYNIPTDRCYYCFSCKLSIHRDINAAKNIMMKGYIELLGKACSQNTISDNISSKDLEIGIENRDIVVNTD